MLILKYILLVVILLIYKSNKCLAENINVLGIVTSTSISNHIYASALFEHLASTGYAVVVVSPFPQSRRVNHISLEDLLEQEDDKKHQQFNKETKKFNSPNVYDNYKKGLERTAETIQHKNFTKLLLKRRPPLFINIIILDYDYNEALIGLGAIYNCPVIILTKEEPKSLLHPLSLPRSLLFTSGDGVGNSNSWLENAGDGLSLILERFYVHFFYLKKQEKLFQQFNTIKSLSFSNVLELHLSKIFITSISRTPLKTIIDNIDVTGFHINERKQTYLQKTYIKRIPEALDEFVHTAKNGIIYVCLGSEFELQLFENEIQKIVAVLQRRKEKIIWSWNGNSSILPSSLLYNDKFYITNWLQQANLMEDLNIKLFITNCGHLSLLESLYFEIPVLGFPITMEQKYICNYVNQKNVGHYLDHETFTMYQVNRTIAEIIDINPKFYMINVQRISLELSEKSISLKKFMEMTIKEIVKQRKYFGPKRSSLPKKFYYKLLVMEQPILIVIFLIFLVSSFLIILRFLLKLRKFYNKILYNRKCKFY